MNGGPPGMEEEAFDWEGMPSAEEQAWADAWYERNKEPLKKLIAEADSDWAAGRIHSSEEVMAGIKAMLDARRQG